MFPCQNDHLYKVLRKQYPLLLLPPPKKKKKGKRNPIPLGEESTWSTEAQYSSKHLGHLGCSLSLIPAKLPENLTLEEQRGGGGTLLCYQNPQRTHEKIHGYEEMESKKTWFPTGCHYSNGVLGGRGRKTKVRWGESLLGTKTVSEFSWATKALITPIKILSPFRYFLNTCHIPGRAAGARHTKTGMTQPLN